jgi:hypothetical protein
MLTSTASPTDNDRAGYHQYQDERALPSRRAIHARWSA